MSSVRSVAGLGATRARVGVGLVLALLAAALLLVRPPAVHAGPTSVAAHYAANGPDRVVLHELVTDRVTGTPYEVFAPKDLGPPGTRHAVITWGNGSFAHPVEYAPMLRHLATWGFVVVAAETDESGTGDEILAATRAILRRDADPTSRFHGHLITDHVGAGGHSQGAGGTARATVHSDGLISAILLADLPSPLFTIPREDKAFHVGALTVPAFFVAGENDTFISSAALNRSYFDHVQGPVAMGLLRGADHNTVQHDAQGYRGDITAWFRYQLLGDPLAATVFTGAHPELLTDPAWTASATRGLTAP